MNRENKEICEPFYKTGFMTHESVAMIRENGVLRGRLLFKPKGKAEVWDSGLRMKFTEGADFRIEGKTIIGTEGSRLPFFEKEWLSGKNLPESIRDHGKQFHIENCMYSDSPFIVEHQIVVSYAFDKTDCPDLSTDYTGKLPLCKHKLKKGEPLRVMLYGDSISTGVDSSGVLEIPPYMGAWYDRVIDVLHKDYGSKIEFTNISQGGMCADWAVENLEDRMGDKEADLLIIAFGMNDATMKRSWQDYMRDIKAIKEYQKNKECEFILIGSMLPNPESAFTGEHRLFAEKLRQLEDRHTAVVDMGAFYEFLLTRKIYTDITGNNINHPNDFTAGCHAMKILEVFKEAEKA